MTIAAAVSSMRAPVLRRSRGCWGAALRRLVRDDHGPPPAVRRQPEPGRERLSTRPGNARGRSLRGAWSRRGSVEPAARGKPATLSDGCGPERGPDFGLGRGCAGQRPRATPRDLPHRGIGLCRGGARRRALATGGSWSRRRPWAQGWSIAPPARPRWSVSRVDPGLRASVVCCRTVPGGRLFLRAGVALGFAIGVRLVACGRLLRRRGNRMAQVWEQAKAICYWTLSTGAVDRIQSRPRRLPGCGGRNAGREP